jgi:hypothetical protein
VWAPTSPDAHFKEEERHPRSLLSPHLIPSHWSPSCPSLRLLCEVSSVLTSASLLKPSNMIRTRCWPICSLDDRARAAQNVNLQGKSVSLFASRIAKRPYMVIQQFKCPNQLLQSASSKRRPHKERTRIMSIAFLQKRNGKKQSTSPLNHTGRCSLASQLCFILTTGP